MTQTSSAASSSSVSGLPTEGSTRLRVRYVECDPMGVAHHSSYLPWMEIGRTELLRGFGGGDDGESGEGGSYADLEAQGFFLVITKLEVKYRRPIRYDDVIEVRTTLAKSSRVKLHHSYELVLVERGGKAIDGTDPSVPSDRVCAVATTELACVGEDGRPTAMPGWMSDG